MKSLLLGCALFLAAVGSQAAQASSIAYTTGIVSTNPDWSSSVSVSKFNPTLGALTGIQFDLMGTITGTIFVENTGPSAANVSETLSATLTLTRPDSSTIVIAFPSTSLTDSFAGYDGTTDFGGTSGVTHGPITTSVMASFISPPPASDLALFTGTGSIALPISAVGTSFVTGPGNLASGFSTSAGASLTVTYFYDAVPEPTSLLLLGGGLLATGWRRRRQA